MTARKNEVERNFAPDFVSAETLAYRLDCSRSTIDDYVRRGLLPRPHLVGTLQRWRWSEVESWIIWRSIGVGPKPAHMDAQSTAAGVEEDPYDLGVKRATSSNA